MFWFYYSVHPLAQPLTIQFFGTFESSLSLHDGWFAPSLHLMILKSG